MFDRIFTFLTERKSEGTGPLHKMTSYLKNIIIIMEFTLPKSSNI
jgi:hypothetical protein